MDVLNTFPPVQEGKTIYNQDVSVFGMSLQGASHKKKDPAVPCQDYSDFRFLEKEGLLLAAIADGVGSCSLSHWGSYVAVTALLDSVEQSIREKNFRGRVSFDDSMNSVMKNVMVTGFRAARDAVEQWGDENGAMVSRLQSTLTLAIYDGKTVFHGHVGDDGIVALLEDGSVHMLTARLKGEEASSVYPLQSGEKLWQFGRSSQPVAAFFMATDGVLDAFVTNRPDYFGINYNNGILYPFISDAIAMMKQNTPDAPEKTLAHYKKYMLGQVYQKVVEDDLSLVAVISNALIKTAKLPVFSVELWQTIQAESNRFRKMALSRKPKDSIGLADILTDESLSSVEEIPPEPPKPPKPPKGPGSNDGSDSTDRLQPEPKKDMRVLTTAVAAALLAGAVLGAAAGRYLFPAVSPEKHAEDQQQIETLAEECEEIHSEYDMLQQDNQELKELYEEALQENLKLTNQSAEQQAQQAAQMEALQEKLDAVQEEWELTDDAVMELVEARREEQAQQAAEAEAAAQAAAAETAATQTTEATAAETEPAQPSDNAADSQEEPAK